jgi:universal stress protein A
MRKKPTASTRKGKRPSPLVGGKIRQILVPTDFSAAAGRALRYAAPLAKRFGAAMVLLHVVPPLTYEADYGYGPVLRRVPNAEKILCATRHLQSTARPTRTLCRRPTCLVRTGNAAEEIVRAARDLKTDLIVMGEGSMAGHEREGGKTIAEKTLHDAPCPVLIVRESGAELLKPGKD